MLDFEKLGHIHFIGAGGVSMSSLVQFCLFSGKIVTGYDDNYGEKIPLLEEKGCRVRIQSPPEQNFSPDIAVYSGAVKPDHPELTFLRSKNIPCLERQIFLSEISSLFRYTIAVGGTHGKTTVTSMLAEIFLASGLPFYGHIGGDTVKNGNFVCTGKTYFLTEACEYRKSLLSLRPDIGIVLNADSDHPDTYRTLSDVYDAFDAFLDASRIKGVSVTNGDTFYFAARQSHNRNLTFGLSEGNDFRAENVREYKKGFFGFSVAHLGIPETQIELSVPGEHNVLNALCAYAVARTVGLSPTVVGASLEQFSGVRRRFEKISKFFGAEVYTDYAHHPAEIKAAIATALRIKSDKGKLYVLFQPHTYSRTARLFDSFCTCFEGTDELLLLKEYPARETPDKGKSAKDLYEKVKSPSKKYFANIVDAAACLMQKAAPGDLILVLGAGDVVNVCSLLKND